MRGAVRGGLAPPRSPAPAPPHPLQSSHRDPPAAASQVRPARQRPEMQWGAALCLRLWLCLGLLHSKHGKLSSPGARLPRGGRSHRPSVGLHRRLRPGDRASVILEHEGTQGRETGVRAPDEARRVRPGPAGMRKGRAGTAAGSGTGLRPHRDAGIVPGFPNSLHHPWLSCVGTRPGRTSFSF